MHPIVSIIGKSKSGKTTIIEKLIPELKSRGYRVATIKHAPEGISSENLAKDNWRHIKAGSEVTAVGSRRGMVLVKPTTRDPGLDEVARLLGEDYDIILAEGYKQGNAPKIEVHRGAVGVPLTGIKRLMAIVTDETLDTKVRQFGMDDIKGLADILEEGFIKPQQERISLYVNNAPVTLTAFPKQIIINVILAMVSSLKGVRRVRSLQIFFRKG